MYLKTENLQALVNGHELNLYQKSLAKKELERLLTLLKDTEEAITVTRCCKSDSEQLRDKKIKDLINLAKSELSDYNKQKVLKIETEEGRHRTKLLKKIIDLQNP